MYAANNPKTKKELKEQVAKWNEAIPVEGDKGRRIGKDGKQVFPVTLFAPGFGAPVRDGRETVEGPHYPEPHKWYAQVEVKDGIVVSVK